jgi:cleavage and polyadenylation specificity factor subunit 1
MAIGDMEVDKSSSTHETLDDNTDGNLLPDVELVTASGYGKNGALCILRRHIRPQSTFSFDQTDCQALWTIKCRSKNDTNDNAATVIEDTTFDTSLDKLLFISKTNSTLVSMCLYKSVNGDQRLNI